MAESLTTTTGITVMKNTAWKNALTRKGTVLPIITQGIRNSILRLRIIRTIHNQDMITRTKMIDTLETGRQKNSMNLATEKSMLSKKSANLSNKQF